MPPPSSVASVRANCEVANWVATVPRPGRRRMAACSRTTLVRDRSHDQAKAPKPTAAMITYGRLLRMTFESANQNPGSQRQLGPEGAVEVLERRHHPDHDAGQQQQRQREQHRRIDHRRERVALHRVDDARVGDEAAQHLVEIAALLAGEQRRGVNGREQGGVIGAGVGEGDAGADLLVDVVEGALEGRVGNLLAQDVERLRQRHAGLQQRRQLLVEEQQLLARHAPAAERRQRRQARQRQPSLRPRREDEVALPLELTPQPGLVVGDVDALDDLPVLGSEAALELHAIRQRAGPDAATGRSPAVSLHVEP